MTANELTSHANKLADNYSNAYDNLINKLGFKDGLSQWNKVHVNYPDSAEFNGVICESTVCFKGHTRYYQNRAGPKKCFPVKSRQSLNLSLKK